MRIRERARGAPGSGSGAVLKHAGSGVRRLHPETVAAGVEEEFHAIDLATRRLTARAGALAEQLPAGRFSSELQRSVL